jgi:hypothetical protein
MAQEPVKITVSGVLEDLKNGYTRTTSEKHYLGEGKSIQEKYGLNKSQVAELFKHDKLKGRKTIVQKAAAFTLVDDTEETTDPEVHESDTTDITDTTDISENDESEEDQDEVPSEEESTPGWM